jgi:alcohol dehydrogenase
MVKNFEFVFPTRVRYGEGVLEELPEIVREYGKEKIFVVTDKGVREAGLVDLVVDILKKEGFDQISVFDEVDPNPRTTSVNRGAEIAKEFGAEILLAIGGGSPIDTAKGIGVLMTNEGIIEDYEGFFKVVNELPPFVTIPTTVGTGSEVTEWAVITDLSRMFKMSVADTKLYPDVALLDPVMVAKLPAPIVASTGMDALSHAIEGYVCKISTPVADAIALYAIELIGENILSAVYADDYEAKANLQLGSMLAGIVISQTDVAGVHCMGEALGGMYDTPHGIANATILPYMMDYCAVAEADKYSRIAKALGIDTKNMGKMEAARAAALAVKELNDDLLIPTLKEVGANPEDFRLLSEKAEANMSNEDNPRVAKAEDYYKMFVKAYEGKL